MSQLNGLDPDGVRWARGFIRDFAERGGAVLISSHLLGELSLVADSVVLIGNGRLLGHEQVVDLVTDTTAVLVRADASPEQLQTVAAHHGWSVQRQPGQPATGPVEVRGAEVTTDAVGRALAGAGLPVLELTARTSSLEEAVMGLTNDHVEYAAKEVVR